jgi:hypothetical protein
MSRSTSHQKAEDASEDDQEEQPRQQRLQRIGQHDDKDDQDDHRYGSRANVPHLLAASSLVGKTQSKLRTSHSNFRSRLVAYFASRRIDRLIFRKLGGFGFSRLNNAETMMKATRTPTAVKRAVIMAGPG